MRNPVKVVYKYKNVHGFYQYILYVFIGDVNQAVKNALALCENGDYNAVSQRVNRKENWKQMKTLEHTFGPDWIKFMFTDEHLKGKHTSHRGGSLGSWLKDNSAITTDGKIATALQDRSVETKIEKVLKLDKSKGPVPFKPMTTDGKRLQDALRRVWIFNQYILEDDTMNMVRTKISAAIQTDPRLGKYTRLIPRRLCMFMRQFPLHGRPIYYHPTGYEYNVDESIWSHALYTQNNMQAKQEFQTIDTMPATKLERYYSSDSDYASIVDNFVSHDNIHASPKMDMHVHQLRTPFECSQVLFLDIYHELSIPKERREVETNKDRFIQTYLLFFFPEITDKELIGIIQLLDFTEKNLEADEIVNFPDAAYEAKRRKMRWKGMMVELNIQNQSINIITRLKQDQQYMKYTRQDIVNHASLWCSVLGIGKGQMSQTTLPKMMYHIFNTLQANEKFTIISKGSRTSKSTKKIYTQIPESRLDTFEKKIHAAKKEFFGIAVDLYLAKFDKSVKMFLDNKGNIEVRTQWSEQNQMSFGKIQNVIYPHIQDWIQKINSDLAMYKRDVKEVSKLVIPRPYEILFKTLNVNQYFELPVKINFNKFRKMLKLFYPYVRLLNNDDRKQMSSIEMLYVRIPNYMTKAQHGLQKFIIRVIKQKAGMQDHEIMKYIQRETNLGEKECMEQIKFIRSNNMIRTALRTTKTLVHKIKYSDPGLKIQVRYVVPESRKKNIDKFTYRCRILGIPELTIFKRIKSFISCIMTLYVELTRGLKRYPWIKEQMQGIQRVVRITGIHDSPANPSTNAKSEISLVKYLRNLDTKRFGFKPRNENDNNYSRLCPRHKQPLGFSDTTEGLQELQKHGYKVGQDGQPLHTRTRQRGVVLLNDQGERRFYICPGKKFPHLSFLARNRHPDQMCLPCCHMKLQSDSPTTHIQELYKSCMSEGKSNKSVDVRINYSYIVQVGHRIHDNRFGYLPRALDILLNKVGRTLTFKVRHGNLFRTGPDGYFFGMGMTRDNSLLLCLTKMLQPSISDAPDLQSERFRSHVSSVLSKSNIMYQSIIKRSNCPFEFNDSSEFVDFVFKFTPKASHAQQQYKNKALTLIVSTPGVLSPNGFHVLHFQCSKPTDQQQIVDIWLKPDMCSIVEQLPLRRHAQTLIILSMNKSFYPVVLVRKLNAQGYTKDNVLEVQRIISPGLSEGEIMKYYNKMYQKEYLTKFDSVRVNNMLQKAGIKISGQILNTYNYCTALVLNSTMIVPTIPSAPLSNLPIVSDQTKHWSLEKLVTFLQRFPEYNRALNRVIGKPHGKDIHVTQVCSQDRTIRVQVQPVRVSMKKLNMQGFRHINLLNKQNHEVDKAIKMGKDQGDPCWEYVAEQNYEHELFQLIRFHISELLSKNKKLKHEVNAACYSKDKKILPNMVTHLFNEFIVIEPTIHTKDYRIVNHRVTCFRLRNSFCNGINFRTVQGKCRLRVPKRLYKRYHRKIVEQFQQAGLEKDELMQRQDAFIDDVIDHNIYTAYENNLVLQKNKYIKRDKNINEQLWKNVKVKNNSFNVIQGTGLNLQQMEKNMELRYKFPSYSHDKFQVQRIIQDTLPFFRAYANGFHWARNPMEEQHTRNLGYIDQLQESLAIFFRGKTVECLKYIPKSKLKTLNKHLVGKFNFESYLSAAFDSDTLLPLIPTVLGLSIIHKYDITIYNEKYKPIIHAKCGDITTTDVKVTKEMQINGINIRMSGGKYETMYYTG